MRDALKHSGKIIEYRHFLWLVAGVGMAVVPHYQHMPLWIVTVSLGLMLYRLAVESGRFRFARSNPFTSSVARVLLVILVFVGIHLQFGTLVGRDAGSALLVLLTGLKIQEARMERDYYIASFLGFFVIITGFFYTQSILSATYMLATLFVMTTSLMVFNDPAGYWPVTRKFKSIGYLLLQAIPVAGILFLLFPRVDGPLWGLPEDAYAGLTGIDDVMEPGSLSELIQSNEVAFRVVFEGDRPSRSDLYWRGPVLWYTDGSQWTRGRSRDRTPGELKTRSEPVRYTITQEPTNKRWLFGLEMPLAAPDDGRLRGEYQLVAKEPVRQRLRYELASSLDYEHVAADQRELTRALQLPEGFHPEARALAGEWRAETSDTGQLVDRTLSLFNEQEFFYTLTPPLLTEDRVDQFLFNTRQGFCEHYAAAFVVLMRAAGVPARVVTGYQGGEYNPIGDYYIVHQRDAHAWAEVWFADRGWIRVDPTAAVSPERVEQGIQQALPDSVIDIPLAFGRNSLSRDLWERFSNTWDAVNNQWNQWVISYGPKRQTQFLTQIGFGTITFPELSLVMIGCVAVLLILVALLLLRKQRQPIEPARKYYDRFCNKLAKIGFRRGASEGPVDFANRVSRQRADLEPGVVDITRLYIATRYASDAGRLRELARRIQRFHPGKA